MDEGSVIGEGTKIWHFTHVMAGATIGRRCNIGQNVVISPGVVIGDNVKIQNNVSVYTGVTLEDDVFCGPSMVFTNVVNPRSHVSRKDEYRPTRAGRGATLGANCTVVCGHSVGRYAFVGAGTCCRVDVRVRRQTRVGLKATSPGALCRVPYGIYVRRGGAAASGRAIENVGRSHPSSSLDLRQRLSISGHKGRRVDAH